MSGHRAFAELTKEFTAERWQRVAEKRAELDKVPSFYMSPIDKERIPETRESAVSCYRSSQSSNLRKPTSRPPKQHMITLRTQPVAELISFKHLFLQTAKNTLSRAAVGGRGLRLMLSKREARG